jgi:antirestriction protein ArdC
MRLAMARRSAIKWAFTPDLSILTGCHKRARLNSAPEGAESYYATLAHECTHWTRHPRRLDRDFGRNPWGDEGYSCEELVAELGSTFLCDDLELHQEPREENAPISQTGLKS